MAVYIGSARIDERGKAIGGKAGDQKQTDVTDYKGEVSQQKFYVSPKGWDIARALKSTHATSIAASMITACDNPNVGYDQGNRLDIMSKGTNTKVLTECDCSSLVRKCVLEATNVDPGNFTTDNEINALLKTGLFKKISYKEGMTLYTGDILVTKTKGHTVVVTVGAPRNNNSKYYPCYNGNTTSIVTALSSVGETDTSYVHRKRIAKENGIGNYSGTASQNTYLLNLLKLGQLVIA